MQRRELIKKLGLMSLAGVAGAAALACNNENKEASSAAAATATVTPEKSEREKLIVNRQRMHFADPANPTKAELKHTPEISFEALPDKELVVVNAVVGSQGIIHPGTAKHWIDYMTFFVNGKEVSHIENENGPVRGFGRIAYPLTPGDTVKVEIGCNIHGIWENSAEYSV